MKQLVFNWDFPAHDLNYDDLLACACAMIEYAIEHCMPEWALSRQRLIAFLAVVRNCYCVDNPYHNYRHAIDVLQAMFYFLIETKCLPDMSATTNATVKANRPRLLTNVQTVAALVAALGHDVGHPGVTNAFLVSTNAPLARIYNDRSVLESFHSASFNQVLKMYWPRLANDSEAREIITQAVLATDMAMHFHYMNSIEAVDLSAGLAKHQTLLCCIMIKCADISNVARTLEISSRWGAILTEEFLEIADLERNLGIKPTTSSLAHDATASERHLALAKGQLFFIDTYGRPLFRAISRVLPELRYTIDFIDSNEAEWRDVVSAAASAAK
jgi:3',5'-cyclic-nucleotide phosphodiesterase